MLSATTPSTPHPPMLKLKEIVFSCYAAVCHLAMVSDPDGNTLCIHQRNQG